MPVTSKKAYAANYASRVAHTKLPKNQSYQWLPSSPSVPASNLQILTIRLRTSRMSRSDGECLTANVRLLQMRGRSYARQHKLRVVSLPRAEVHKKKQPRRQWQRPHPMSEGNARTGGAMHGEKMLNVSWCFHRPQRALMGYVCTSIKRSVRSHVHTEQSSARREGHTDSKGRTLSHSPSSTRGIIVKCVKA